MESFSLYIHIFSRSQRFLSKIEKKLWGSKNPENGFFQKSHLIKKDTYFFVLFLFLLQDNSYSCLVLKFQVSKLKIAKEIIKACVVILVTHNTLLDLLKIGSSYFGSFENLIFKKLDLLILDLLMLDLLIYLLYTILVTSYPSHIILMALLIISISIRLL